MYHQSTSLEPCTTYQLPIVLPIYIWHTRLLLFVLVGLSCLPALSNSQHTPTPAGCRHLWRINPRTQHSLFHCDPLVSSLHKPYLSPRTSLVPAGVSQPSIYQLFTPPIMADEDLLAIIVLLSNFLSAYYTAFCIEASTKRYHWFYKGLHRNDLNWYATWYSCQVCLPSSLKDVNRWAEYVNKIV